jgi:isoleucyl-tRNA synthetase
LPLPIYSCSCGQITVIGSRLELEQRAVPTPVRIPELHRPWIDAIRIRCPQCGEAVERIPEVGDAWLDAGIVPYSTLHYLDNKQYWQTWFPAEFITEMREQIRLWFYSMLFMSVTLEDCVPYQSALVYEKLMDVNGRPMHRSLGNAIWFEEAVGRMGADAMRWLFASQNTETNLLFGYGPAEEVTRKLLVLWNVYSFFITYANIDHFDPAKHASNSASRPFLDRWILTRLNSLVLLARDRLDHYDAAAVTRESERFIEDLSNWWLRCNRRRFWKSEEDGEKVSAYLTLYEVLVTFVRLVAPILPFLAEQIYQNLVCSVVSDTPCSVHLTSYPEPLPITPQDDCEPRMGLIQRVIGLGRAARNKAGIKIRQPITKMILVGFSAAEQEVIQELSDVIKDELNLKELVFQQTARGLQEILLLPNLPLLGPRFGKRLPAVRAALTELDSEQALLRLQDQRPLSVLVDGVEILLQPEEILVQRLDQLGFAAEAEGQFLVVLDTDIPPQLRREGLARDVAHAIQNLRKEAGFKVEDRIRIFFRASPELTGVLQEYAQYLKKETLSQELSATDDLERTMQPVVIDGAPVHFLLEKIG